MLNEEASRTQPGSDLSRAWEAPALRAPRAPDLGFGLSRASRFGAGSRIRVKACPGQGLRSFHSLGLAPLAAEARRPSITQQDAVTSSACGCCWTAAAARRRSQGFLEGGSERGSFQGLAFRAEAQEGQGHETCFPRTRAAMPDLMASPKARSVV